MNYWLVKSEPFKYSWDNFVEQKVGMWDGVRNYQARNNLKAMQLHDLVLFYHSNEGVEVVGIAKVVREHYPDPTADDDKWVVVDLAPVEKLPKSVTLKQIKNDERLQNMALIKQSRLSVTPVRPEEFDIIIGLAHE
ncbi:EVE domain-containing protein [Flectobacillus major]|uniref:EVE domain-containing protein n=1 Tax=Flectobacillus major TaxID=103 RepID=UPI00047E9F73|nr:EVE domain-containing protein [Flectobacillus major]